MNASFLRDVGAANYPPEGVGVLLGVFAKHWTPGRAKTRLAATLGAKQAATVSQRLAKATFARLHDVGTGRHSRRRVVAATPGDRLEEVRDELPDGERATDSWEVIGQPSGTLGDRMRWFFDEVRRPGEVAVLLGTDSPDFPRHAIHEAVERLREPGPRSRTVLGPSDDGGYWLVGVRGETPPIFGSLPWSQPELFEATLERLEKASAAGDADYHLVERWYDVDTEADLIRLRESPANGDPAIESLHRELDGLLGPLRMQRRLRD